MKTKDYLARIADALEEIAATLALSEQENERFSLAEANAYHWQGESGTLLPVPKVSRVPLNMLRGIESVRDILLKNTEQFARGHGANNALLWGARGMGKSSLVKAIHADIEQREGFERLVLIEIAREDLETLPALMRIIAGLPARFVIFCDDLSFDAGETSYKSLKTILDGGLEGRPDNVLFYATSNRRHLMPRDMIENEKSTAINPGEAVEEKVSLSDRFGLWLGFHNSSQDTYLEMVSGYARFYDLAIDAETLRARAIEWAATRGSRSGRVAIQLVRTLAGEEGKVV
ncbi:ATP-binding protein [Devosia sp. 63-57]|uniref:ATP-binding protein n=1 Tax=Devosia sp. 63-57 TaxID=1895751 RepID=UPI00086D2514|nr:ATP-binding protein [Devosia sp. 63-57]ODT48646.1 MAG: AAA family ATPase [Pelagibacterium sp. SCN 63-126]ODU86524.1 MAG: AAA family ATPase [Pelagibacterium sp. SCN 63-17]OJX45102.1 MAG: AAA family ATPase [Devosia sp. 63-57]